MSAKSKWQAAATAASAASTLGAKTRGRKAQRGVPFNMMVVGQSGLGKSTFVRCLVEKDMIPVRDYQEFNDLTEKTVDVIPYNEEIDADGQKILLTVVDTPGFGENVDNSDSFLRILEYTEAQHKRYLAEETRVQRNAKFQDTRVHAILYFIPPTGHHLRDLDIVFMKKLGTRTNIIPVIGKADSLTPKELKAFKQRIMEDIQKHSIPIFDFPVNSEDDEDIVKENKEFRAQLPFAVVSSNETHEVNGESVVSRRYPWGDVIVSNEKHSDYESVRLVLLISHMEVLKEVTNDVHYEHFREESLTKAGGTLESKKIEQELKDFETAESEMREKLKAQRERRISLKLQKSTRRPEGRPSHVKEESDSQSTSDEAKKKKAAKPKKAGEEEDDGKKKIKKKVKKKEDEGQDDGKDE